MLRFKEFINETAIHPHKDEHGGDVILRNPSEPSPIEHWGDPNKHATVVPRGEMPPELNGVRFDHYTPPSDWNTVEGQGDFAEPPLEKHGKQLATGAIIHEPCGRVWTISPSNQFAGYVNTIGPKGRVDPGLNLHANAIKEAHEETGLKIRLTGHAHDSHRKTTMTRYYHAVRTGGHPGDMGWETQAVHLVPKDKLEDHLNDELDKNTAREAVLKKV